MKKTVTHLLLLALSLVSVVACANSGEAAEDKLAEEDAPMDGKLDGASIADQGSLAWMRGTNNRYTTEANTSLSAMQRAVSWTFALSGDATVTLSLGKARSNGRELDTVMYLYQQDERGNWGSYIERNDDTSRTNLWSTLRNVDLSQGNYRVIVKGYSRRDVGTFKISGACSGAGCMQASLETSFNAVAPKANYMSESDYAPIFISGTSNRTGAITQQEIHVALGSTVAQWLAGENEVTVTPAMLRYQAYTRSEASNLMTDLRTSDYEEEDESAAAWATINELFDNNLIGLTMYKIGLPDEDGNWQDDNGLYAIIYVGRTGDGKLAGFLVGTVET